MRGITLLNVLKIVNRPAVKTYLDSTAASDCEINLFSLLSADRFAFLSVKVFPDFSTIFQHLALHF